MSTFMSPATFEALEAVRKTLARDHEVAEVFVPWAGSRLESRGGLYYLGQATDANYGNRGGGFNQQLDHTKHICQQDHDLANSPFWRFLDGLTTPLLGGSYDQTSDRWGWSNLLKIGAIDGTPNRWASRIRSEQRNASLDALREEMAHLKNSLIFVASGQDLGIVERTFQTSRANKTHAHQGIFWRKDDRENLVVQSYHPKYAQQRGLFDSILKITIRLARENLDWAGK